MWLAYGRVCCTHKVLYELLVVHALDQCSLPDSAAHASSASGKLLVLSYPALKLGHLFRYADLLIVLRLQLLEGAQDDGQSDTFAAVVVKVGEVDQNLAGDLAAWWLRRDERLGNGIDDLGLPDGFQLSNLVVRDPSLAPSRTFVLIDVRRHFNISNSMSTSAPDLLRRCVNVLR